MTIQTRTLTISVIREDDRYVAQCSEVDVSSFGDTQEEAIAMVTEALELWFEGTGTRLCVRSAPA